MFLEHPAQAEIRTPVFLEIAAEAAFEVAVDVRAVAQAMRTADTDQQPRIFVLRTL